MSNGLGFISFYTYAGIKYFSNVDFNGLFCQNMANKEINFIDVFPNEILTKRFIHRSVIGKGEKMFFFPLFGNGITEYDLKNKSFRFLKMNNKNRILGISGTFLYQQEVILIPSSLTDSLLIFSMDTFEIKYVSVLKKLLNQYGIDSGGVDLFGSVLYKDYIYIALCETNLIVEINLNSYKVKIHVMETGIHFRNISIIDGDLWGTTTDNGIILKMNLNSWEVNKIQIADLINFHRAVLRVEKWSDQIIIVPGTGYQLFKLENEVFKSLNRDIPEDMLGDVVGYEIDENLNLFSQKGVGETGRMNGGYTVVPHDPKVEIYRNELIFQGYEIVERNIRDRYIKGELKKNGFIMESVQETLNGYLEWVKIM